MRRGLFFSRASGPAGPRGRRAYAVGDIHGCLDLLESLLGRIESDIADNPRAKTSIVFLGDVVDRGPHSAEVVERLRARLGESDFAQLMRWLQGRREVAVLVAIHGEPFAMAIVEARGDPVRAQAVLSQARPESRGPARPPTAAATTRRAASRCSTS